MPNKSAGRKALRQTKKHAIANQLRRDAMKNAIKKLLKAASADEAKKLLPQAQKALDKAAKVGIIKKNTASRKLSRLMKKFAKKK